MKNLEFQNITLAQKLFGTHNANLEKIARAFDVKINSRGGQFRSVVQKNKQTRLLI